MTGLLRKYKISKISDNVKLTEVERMLCDFLDKTFIGLEKPYNLPYYVNSDDWVFEISSNYLCVNILIKPFFDNLRFEDYKEALFVNNYVKHIIFDWLEDLYHIDKDKLILIWTVDNHELNNGRFIKKI